MTSNTEAVIAFLKNSTAYKEKKVKGDKRRFNHVMMGALYEIRDNGDILYSRTGKVKDLVAVSEEEIRGAVEMGKRLL